MKDQYVGDVNDFLKYSLLRAIAQRLPRGLLICWMLTPDDRRSDGSLIQYLDRIDKFRAIDPPLFDAMAATVRGRSRNVATVEAAGLIPKAGFHSRLLPDDESGRRTYFEEVSSAMDGRDAVFFDPDNGFSVSSVRRGRRHSSKYLYWDEFASTYARGLSVVVYQHFPRVARDQFVDRIAARMRELSGAPAVCTVYSSRVAYFAAPQPEHRALVERGIDATLSAWNGNLRATLHAD